MSGIRFAVRWRRAALSKVAGQPRCGIQDECSQQDIRGGGPFFPAVSAIPSRPIPAAILVRDLGAALFGALCHDLFDLFDFARKFLA
jgi:hypothetical protein